MVKEIILTRGKVALVDDADYKELNRYRWCALKGFSTFYAHRRAGSILGIQKMEYMHRVVMGVSDKNILIDHINKNGLDNRRENLRLCNKSQNGMNRGKQLDNTTGYKGVTIQKHNKKNPYRASIQVDGKMINLGYYKTPEDAAKAYDRAAIKYKGEFSKTNF